MQIEVVNVKGIRGEDRNCITYVGREFAGWKKSALGNPFKMGSTPDPIESYRQWLWKSLNDPFRVGAISVAYEFNLILQSVINGDTVRLGCWCHPSPCHADIVKRALEYYLTQE